MSLNGTLDDLVAELEKMLARAEGRVADRQQDLNEAKMELARIWSILRAAGVQKEEKPKRKRERKGDVSEETRALVLKAIWEHEQAGEPAVEGVPGSFAVGDLEPDLHETSVRAAVYALREQGVLRVVGKKPVGRARSPLAYARVVVEAEPLHVG